MEEGCWLSGVSKNGIVGAQGGPTLFGSHCTNSPLKPPRFQSAVSPSLQNKPAKVQDQIQVTGPAYLMIILKIYSVVSRETVMSC